MIAALRLGARDNETLEPTDGSNASGAEFRMPEGYGYSAILDACIVVRRTE